MRTGKLHNSPAANVTGPCTSRSMYGCVASAVPARASTPSTRAAVTPARRFIWTSPSLAWNCELRSSCLLLLSGSWRSSTLGLSGGKRDRDAFEPESGTSVDIPNEALPSRLRRRRAGTHLRARWSRGRGGLPRPRAPSRRQLPGGVRPRCSGCGWKCPAGSARRGRTSPAPRPVVPSHRPYAGGSLRESGVSLRSCLVPSGSSADPRAELGAGANAELAVDTREVRLDRLRTDECRLRHLAVRQAGRRQLGDESLRLRELVRRATPRRDARELGACALDPRRSAEPLEDLERLGQRRGRCPSLLRPPEQLTPREQRPAELERKLRRGRTVEALESSVRREQITLRPEDEA